MGISWGWIHSTRRGCTAHTSIGGILLLCLGPVSGTWSGSSVAFFCFLYYHHPWQSGLRLVFFLPCNMYAYPG
jgi:hypothetical protein